MELGTVALALLSAVLHAGWNAAIKASPRPAEAMTAQMILSAVLMVPLLVWTGLPGVVTVPWIVMATGFNILGVTAMLRAYETAGFGTVYPMVRALAVMLVVPLTVLISGDALRPWSVAGVGLIATSLVLLAFGSRGPHATSPRAIPWILLSGAAIAVVVLCDAQAVRRSNAPLAYGCVASLTNALFMAWRQRSLGHPWRMITDNVSIALPASVASAISFLMILWVYNIAPIAAAAALRDTSAVFALLIAVFWLREPLSRMRIAAIVLAAAAIPLLRLA